MKLTPKQLAVASHKLVALSYLMQLTIDEIGIDTEMSDELKQALKVVENHAESLMDISYKTTSVSKTNYLQDLVNKVDTTIRKNYKLMPDSEV